MAQTTSIPKLTSRQAADEPFLELVRELARTYQAFAARDAALLRDRGLTMAQGDVVFTLGNTPGLTLGDLGERTLITKGTLTGVVDRLEKKGLVRRAPASHDGRCTIASLTKRGEALFERVFPAHIAALKEHFDQLDPRRQRAAVKSLREIRAVF